jgi:hypothetical protein
MPPRLATPFVLWPPIGQRHQIAQEATDYAVASVYRSRNTDIDREADDLAAVVADLNVDLESA